MEVYDKMHDCFDSMKDKIDKAIKDTDLQSLFKTLSSIKEPTLVTGVGGSSIVAMFLAKTLREKNKIIATFAYPRDMKYMNLDGYKNVISVSYSGANIGVDASFDNDLNKYLLTGNPRVGINNIVYKMPKENSYVSINATIVPLSLILLYYQNDINTIYEIINSNIQSDSNNNSYELIYGYESIAAATMLESSIIESGMGSIVLHEKYNYAHGRINITRNTNSDLIFFKSNNEYDEVLAKTLPSLYKKIITIDSKYDDIVVNDYYLALMGLKLVGAIADNKKVDISCPNELEQNDIFYLYKGNL